MNAAALCEFFENEIQDCFDKKLMMSLHMKATMMKVSDPIIFGHWSVSFPALGYWPFLTFSWGLIDIFHLLNKIFDSYHCLFLLKNVHCSTFEYTKVHQLACQ